MSQKEIDRLQALEKLVAKNVRQIDAARQFYEMTICDDNGVVLYFK